MLRVHNRLPDLSRCHLEIWTSDSRNRLELWDTRTEGYGLIATADTDESGSWDVLVAYARGNGGDNPDWKQVEREREQAD